MFLFRLLILLLHGDVLGDSILQVVPGALFYVVYGIIFKLSVSNKHIASLRKITGAVLCADFGAGPFQRVKFQPDRFLLHAFHGLCLLQDNPQAGKPHTDGFRRLDNRHAERFDGLFAESDF